MHISVQYRAWLIFNENALFCQFTVRLTRIELLYENDDYGNHSKIKVFYSMEIIILIILKRFPGMDIIWHFFAWVFHLKSHFWWFIELKWGQYSRNAWNVSILQHFPEFFDESTTHWTFSSEAHKQNRYFLFIFIFKHKLAEKISCSIP